MFKRFFLSLFAWLVDLFAWLVRKIREFHKTTRV